MARAKSHHYVPQVYLRHWAHDGRVAVRRRDRPDPFVASIRKVARETDLYTVDSDGMPSDVVEERLATIEGLMPNALASIRRFQIPRRGTPERLLLASLLALQYIRTPDRMEMATFPVDALKSANGVRPVSKAAIIRILEERWGYKPTPANIECAWDFVNFSLDQQPQLSRTDLVNLRFSTLPEVADRLAAKSWAVEVSKGQHFITSDQPLSLWLKRPSAVRGVGVEGADEIRFPASPHHLVVLRPRGKDSTYVVPRVRVASVNQHAAATCRQLIIAEGSQTSVLQQLTLRAHRPMLKMNEAPGYREGPNGLESVGGIMHFFNPYDDRDPRDYPSELPTDAVVEERCRLPRELRRVSAGSGPRRPRMVDRSGEIFRAPHEAIDPSSTRRGQKMDHPSHRHLEGVLVSMPTIWARSCARLSRRHTCGH